MCANSHEGGQCTVLPKCAFFSKRKNATNHWPNHKRQHDAHWPKPRDWALSGTSALRRFAESGRWALGPKVRVRGGCLCPRGILCPKWPRHYNQNDKDIRSKLVSRCSTFSQFLKLDQNGCHVSCDVPRPYFVVTSFLDVNSRCLRIHATFAGCAPWRMVRWMVSNSLWVCPYFDGWPNSLGAGTHELLIRCQT